MMKDPTEFRNRFAAWKDGKKPYDGGRIAEVVITPDQEYNQFLNTLPDNQRVTPEENYTTHRYWELNDKPKNFSQAIQKGMYTMEPDGWHANTVQENKKTGEIEFMKPWNHSSIGYEYNWYRSSDPEAVEFRKQYKHVPSVPNAKYVPRFKDRKLPGYYLGRNDFKEEKADATTVNKPMIVLPVKRIFTKSVVPKNWVEKKQKEQPVVQQGKNYTQRRVEEETKHVPNEVYSVLQGIGMGADATLQSMRMPAIYSSLKAAKELSNGNVLSGIIWGIPFGTQAKAAISSELKPWLSAEKTLGKEFKFNPELYYRGVNLDAGDMPLSAIDDANSIGIIRSLNKSFDGRPYFSVGKYKNTSFPQSGRDKAVIQADPKKHDFVSVDDFSHRIQQTTLPSEGETVMPIIKTPSVEFPGGDLRSGAFSYWTPEKLFGINYWRNRRFVPNVNSRQLQYIDALRNGDVRTAQNVVDNTYLQKAGQSAIMSESGKIENMVHTIGDQYNHWFREFNPGIEGQNSFIYTTDAAGRPMSSSYSSYFLSKNEAETNALSRFNAWVKNTKRDIEYLKESINDPNTSDLLKKSYKRSIERMESQLDNRKAVYDNFLEQNLRKLNPDRQLRLYGKLDNPIVIDAGGRGWNSFLGPDAFGGKTEMSTRELEKLIQTANDVDFGTNLGAKPGIIDGAVVKNVVDYGGKKITDPKMTPHTVFEFATPNQLKLSKPVTYTRDGFGVWPWQRFDWTKADFHY